MKSNKRIFSFFMILSLLIGCDDFLEIEPLDRVDGLSFFSNDEEMVIAVNGVYAAQRLVFSRGDGGQPLIHRLFEERSDNAGGDHTDQAERVETDLFNEGTGNLPISGLWEAMWGAVNLANKVIASGATAEGNQELIGRIVGEAKFVRASIYFYMVNAWGGVPIRTEPTEDFSATILPRSTVADVYSLIIQDLTDAKDLLPISYEGGNGNEIGRATNGAALTLLGKVQLQNGELAAAESTLRQVLGSYSLLPDYGSIHSGAGNENSVESIFEINFNAGNQTAWGVPQQFVPQSIAAQLGTNGSSRNVLSSYPTQDLADSFDSADLRIPSTFGTATEGSYQGLYISKYIQQGATSGSDINFVMLRYADVLLMLAEAIGESPEAYGYINEVRSRAGLPDIDASSPGTFMEKLMNERRWEFAFELHRWIDLLRLSDTEVISIMENQIEAQQLSKFQSTIDITLSPDNLLYPIPQNEIDISGGVVEQNPGY